MNSQGTIARTEVCAPRITPEPADAEHLQHQADLDHPAGTKPWGEQRRRGARQQCPASQRNERRARVQRTEAERALQVEREHEQQPELTEGNDQSSHVAAAEALDCEQTQVHYHEPTATDARPLDRQKAHHGDRGNGEDDRDR